MLIQVIAVGKLKETYWRQALAEYDKRLRPYAKVEFVEVPDEKAPDQLSPAEEQQIKGKEGEKVLARVRPDAHVIALALEGAVWTSEQFADRLQSRMTYSGGSVAFIIGGSLGLSNDVLQRADQQISFGRMTMPHQLVRIVLAEQLYRAFKIMRGQAYHK